MIYLNNAATSWPKPESVYHAVDFHTRHYGAGFGRGNDTFAEKSSEVVYATRCDIADLFGVPDAARVIFTYSATDSINIALKGYLKHGDHVIVSDMEHHAVMRPLMKMRERGTITLSFAISDESGMVLPESVGSLITDRTRLVVISHVSNVTGSRNDITAIGGVCASAGVTFMVDASQSAGAYPIDVKRDHIGVLALSGHKGLFGPQGTGILYVAPGIEIDTLREGGTGSVSRNYDMPQEYPDRFECGTMNSAAIAGLGEGVRFVRRIGHDTIRERKCLLSGLIRESVADIRGMRIFSSANAESDIFTFMIDGHDISEIADHLSGCDIAIRSGLHCNASAHSKLGTIDTGLIRVSPGFFTSVEEVKAFEAAVKRFVGS